MSSSTISNTIQNTVVMPHVAANFDFLNPSSVPQLPKPANDSSIGPHTTDLPVQSQPPDIQSLRQPGLSREGTSCASLFSVGPLTPHGSEADINEERPEGTSIYTIPDGSKFDATYGLSWFQNPRVVENEVVSHLGDLTSIPPSAWRMGPDGLQMVHDVPFRRQLPIGGPVPPEVIRERAQQALMRDRELKYDDSEEVEVEEMLCGRRRLRSQVKDENGGGDKDKDKGKKQLGPEGTEMFDHVLDYPPKWLNHGLEWRSTERFIE